MAESESQLIFSEFEKMPLSLSAFEQSDEFNKTDWVVTEKIHGANMSFHTDGSLVSVARRRDFVGVENFFGYKTAEFMKSYPEKVKDIFKLVVDYLGNVDVTQVSVYGELFGGRYVHKDCETPNKKLKPVQLEIQYCPNIRFCAFDISYRVSHNTPHAYIDYVVAMDMFEKVEMFYAKPIYTGKVNDCIHYQLGFNSTIPAMLNLPPLEEGTNKAEGIVVKPLREIRANTKSDDNERVMLKIKIATFLEWGNTKDKANFNKKSTNNGKVPSGRPDKVLMPRLVAYINPNRITSGISKHGLPENDQQKMIDVVMEIYNDVLSDAMATEDDIENWYKKCDDKQKKNIEKCLKAKITSGIEKHGENMDRATNEICGPEL